MKKVLISLAFMLVAAVSYAQDGIHVRLRGDSIIYSSMADYNFDIFTVLDEGKEFDFHGFKGKEFESDGLRYKVVQPHVTNKNRSWVIRARFWNHQSQLDRVLLKLGYHITYCDVENLFGSPEAVERWNSFYKIMRKTGLNRKVVLEGMSRGGLIVYNWAAENPKKVSAIYADAPVLDLKSWPFSSNKYSKEQDLALEAYGFTLEEMMNYGGNPMDNAAKIAKSKIPIIHVVGDDDVIVPYTDNTERFAEILRDNGVEIEVIVKEGFGHHPHSLRNPKPLAEFILRAEGIIE
ncbi:MAG: prolyl oligopeptidase family serine peptidase [Rikenellaceae bacterium]